MEKKRWSKEFYQDDPNEKNPYTFYHRQRNVTAVLEECGTLKHGNIYIAKVISIELKPDAEFRVMGVAGGCRHQYKIGETFHLRKHKYMAHNTHYYFDVRYLSQYFAEEFKEITN